MKIRMILAIVILLSPIFADAGQPWWGSELGKPYRWQNGVIEWISVPGDLAASVNNAEAVKWVEEAFDKWAKAALYNSAAGGLITTVDLHPSKGGVLNATLSADPKSNDFYLNTILNGKLPPTIIFDKDGSILAHLCKTYLSCNPDDLMAYTMVSDQMDLDPATHAIRHGVTILNGTQINKTGIDTESFKASVLHEIGHLLGLDHSALNDGYATTVDSKLDRKPVANMGKGIPTMYPVNDKEEGSLHNDDVMAISMLYPSTAFTSQFCSLIGKVVDGSGAGIQGVEVVARTTIAADWATDAYSAMTGVNFPVPTRDGHYYIYGLVPGKKYAVGLAPLPRFKSDGSGVGRYGKETGVEPPAFKVNCDGLPKEHCDALGRDIAAGGGATYEVSCDKGGQQIVMDTVSLHPVTIDAKYSSAPTPTVDDPPPPPPAAASGKSGCTLIR